MGSARGAVELAGRPPRRSQGGRSPTERDRVNAALEEIYKTAPRTNTKAYVAAQNALKEAEELFFSDEELNKMLPKRLRTACPHKP